MAQEPEMVCVYQCQGIDLAQVFKCKLEAEGIPVLLKYESAGLIYGVTVDGLGRVRLFVPAEFADEARALLSEEDEPGEPVEDDEAAPKE